MTDIVPAAEPVEVDTSALAETLAVSGQDEWDPVVARQGKVTAVTPGVAEASVCSVSVGGAAPIDNVRHLCDTPEVNDTVWLLQVGPMRIIIGIVGGSEKVGAIKWIGGTGGAPPGWWPCDGRSTAGYPKLAARYGANIPDLRDRFVQSSGTSNAVGATGGNATTTAVASHAHVLNNHSHTTPSHTHPGFDHNHATPAHSHPQNVSASVGGPAVRSDYDEDAAGSSFPQGINTGSGGAGTTGTDGAAYTTGSGGGQGTGIDGGGGNVGTTGTAGGIENRPPFYTLLAIIKFG